MDSKSVINRVKKAAQQIQNIINKTPSTQNVEVLELDEMCTILKKIKQVTDTGQLWNVKQNG